MRNPKSLARKRMTTTRVSDVMNWLFFGWNKSKAINNKVEEMNSGDRKLIVGLGNPGRKYVSTRHNIGFDVVSQVAKNWHAGSAKQKFKGEVVDVSIGDHQVSLLCPHTFMNASGGSVKAAVDFYKLSPLEVLVVCDDFALNLAKLRFRPKGSSGGQNGLKDIIRLLGTDEVPRLRMGIGKPPDSWDVADYVLSKFKKHEETDIEIAVNQAADAVADWVSHGTDYCMNKYNGI